MRASIALVLVVLVSALWIFGSGELAGPLGSEAHAAPGPAAKADTAKVNPHQLELAQRYLHAKGLFHSKPDGHMNPATRAALKVFQKKRGLKITGTLDTETLVAMQLAPAPQAPINGK